MPLGTLQFETKLQTCIRIGTTIFKIFTGGGILSDIYMYGRKSPSAAALVHHPKPKFLTVYQRI